MPDPILPTRSIAAAYDYIVVGAGSGGCAVARRLVDGSDATVLLIEAGGAGIGIPEIDNPASWVSLGRSAYDWGYDYAPNERVNGRTIGIPRGKVLGGCSSINAMMWYRGSPLDYDGWDAGGADGWAFKDVLPCFKRCEDWEEWGDGAARCGRTLAHRAQCVAPPGCSRHAGRLRRTRHSCDRRSQWAGE
jgi:choline dehydrogenase-like flavoprotein